MKSNAEQMTKIYQRFGCLPPAPDGPVLAAFHAKRLGEAMEKEIQRAIEYGWSKITLHMDVQDALALAKHLKGR